MPVVFQKGTISETKITVMFENTNPVSYKEILYILYLTISTFVPVIVIHFVHNVATDLQANQKEVIGLTFHMV